MEMVAAVVAFWCCSNAMCSHVSEPCGSGGPPAKAAVAAEWVRSKQVEEALQHLALGLRKGQCFLV